METKEAVENLDDILSVPGVDCALIGPNDLSIALGGLYLVSASLVTCLTFLAAAGQNDSPALKSAIEKTIKVCQEKGVIPGIHVNDLQMGLYR